MDATVVLLPEVKTFTCCRKQVSTINTSPSTQFFTWTTQSGKIKKYANHLYKGYGAKDFFWLSLNYKLFSAWEPPVNYLKQFYDSLSRLGLMGLWSSGRFPAHDRRIGSLQSFPTQTILSVYDSVPRELPETLIL